MTKCSCVVHSVQQSRTWWKFPTSNFKRMCLTRCKVKQKCRWFITGHIDQLLQMEFLFHNYQAEVARFDLKKRATYSPCIVQYK